MWTWRRSKPAAPSNFGRLVGFKGTEGTGYTDGFLASRWSGAAAAGIAHRLVYAFGHPGEGGVAQAEYLLQAVTAGGHEIHAQDIVAYDCEVSDGEAPSVVAAAARDFASTIAKHVAAVRWLYGGGPFLQENGVSLDGYAGHWLAAYVPNPDPYEIFGAGKTIAWQYTDGAHGPAPRSAPGVGACDISLIL